MGASCQGEPLGQFVTVTLKNKCDLGGWTFPVLEAWFLGRHPAYAVQPGVAIIPPMPVPNVEDLLLELLKEKCPVMPNESGRSLTHVITDARTQLRREWLRQNKPAPGRPMANRALLGEILQEARNFSRGDGQFPAFNGTNPTL